MEAYRNARQSSRSMFVQKLNTFVRFAFAIAWTLLVISCLLSWYPTYNSEVNVNIEIETMPPPVQMIINGNQKSLKTNKDTSRKKSIHQLVFTYVTGRFNRSWSAKKSENDALAPSIDFREYSSDLFGEYLVYSPDLDEDILDEIKYHHSVNVTDLMRNLSYRRTKVNVIKINNIKSLQQCDL